MILALISTFYGAVLWQFPCYFFRLICTPMKLRLIYKTQENTKRIKIHVEPETTIQMLKKRNNIARITDQDDFELLDNDKLGNILDDNEIIVCYSCTDGENSKEGSKNKSEERPVKSLSEIKIEEQERTKKKNTKSKSIAAKFTSAGSTGAVSAKVRDEHVSGRKENVQNRSNELIRGRARNNVPPPTKSEKKNADHTIASPAKNTVKSTTISDGIAKISQNNSLDPTSNTVDATEHGVCESSSIKQPKRTREREANRKKEQATDSNEETATKMSMFKSFNKRENEKKLTLDDL